MYTKAGGTEFLKSYLGLLSCHQTSCYKWCSLARPSKGQCTISKILSSIIFYLFIEQNTFFLETCVCLYHFRAKIHGVVCYVPVAVVVFGFSVDGFEVSN